METSIQPLYNRACYYELYALQFCYHNLHIGPFCVNRLKSIGNYIKKNKIKRFILVTDNATFHVSRKTKQFIENQLHWLTVIFLPKRSPNLNPVETRVNRNLKKDVCANHNYGTEENLTNAVTRYLRCMGCWPKL